MPSKKNAICEDTFSPGVGGGGQRRADAQLWEEDLSSTHSTYYFIILIKNVVPTCSRLLTSRSPYYNGENRESIRK